MTVRKAVIPAAGLGTRFLPATKSQPKEMIPVIDKPGIQYAIEEAVDAGIDDILIVTSRSKSVVEDHFDRSAELERHLEAAGKTEELREVRRISELADIFYIRQKEPRGWGEAVALARRHVGVEPFAIMLPDEIVAEAAPGEKSFLQSMVDVYSRYGSSVVGVQEVRPEEIVAYGALDPEPVEDNVVRVRDMIEKPSLEEAPSNLASRGRYVFTSDIFDALDDTTAGHGGEIQFTDAIRILAKRRDVYAYVYEGDVFDVGNKLDYLQAVVELTLRREDLGKPFRDFLIEVTKRYT
jgi:UTP--glucose-1-phosphate uridylyltransferase